MRFKRIKLKEKVEEFEKIEIGKMRAKEDEIKSIGIARCSNWIELPEI